MPEEPKEKSLFRQLLQASTVGLNLVISTFVGLAIGYGLDYAMEKWFGLPTKPWLMVIFLILGIISGFRDLFKMATRSDNESDKKNI